MRVTKIKSSIIASLISLLFLFPWIGKIQDHGLRDVVKPHLGIYECRLAQWGGQDYLEDFEFFKLELKKDNSFTITAKPKLGATRQGGGKYEYNEGRESIVFCAENDSSLYREGQLKNGVIFLSVPIAGKTARFEFER